ncbi:hypothetical protein BKG93_08340 [Rodentibacter ratti]|uniref:Uncharacterized protein n=1 Tax=Rodentibacter ratti TaxID=1906745 RepID=A0A1V3L3I4_9PAST|nr:hypothetical protein [Rodentibacter ratti]OOF84170.1 hypothetical protein BKG93_08340 [Rodentibacter ratti]
MNKRQKRKKKKEKQTAMRAKSVFFSELQAHNEEIKPDFNLEEKENEGMKNHQLTNTLKGAFYVAVIALIALIALWQCRPAFANATDWYNNSVSEQISQRARAEARKLWREENGDWQANLTPQAEQELLHYTAQKQAAIDRTLRGK